MATIVQCDCGAEYKRTETKFLAPHTGHASCKVCGATADGEKGFQGANTVLVSSTVRPPAIPRRALKSNDVDPGRHPSSQMSGSHPAEIRVRAESRKACLLRRTRSVPSGSFALDWPCRFTRSRLILIVALPSSHTTIRFDSAGKILCVSKCAVRMV
jgi:hypothetical protein